MWPTFTHINTYTAARSCWILFLMGSGGDLVTNSWLWKEKKHWTRNMISRFELQTLFFFLFLCDIGFKEIDTLGTVWSGFRWALLIKMLKFCVWTPFFVFNDLVGLYIHILWTSICRSRRPHPVEALTNRVLTWDNLTWTGVIYNCISWWHGLNRYPKLNYE